MKFDNNIFDFSKRQSWIDSIRGLAILLIILGHWTTQISYSQEGYFIDFLKSFSLFFAPIRLELLFFLSGVVVSISYRKGLKSYIKGKVNNILWPYMVWSVIMLTLLYVSDFFSGRFLYKERLIESLLGFLDLTWFLYFVFLYYIFVIFVRKLNFLIVFFSLVFFSYVLSSYDFLIDKPSLRFSDLFYYFIFFTTGDYIVRKDFLIKNNFLILMSFFMGILFIFFGNFFFNLNKTSIFFLLPVFMIFPFLFHVFYYLNKSFRFRKINNLINYIGRNSLFFYLVHYPVILISGFILKILNLQNIFVFFLILLGSFFLPMLLIKYKNIRMIKLLFSANFFR